MLQGRDVLVFIDREEAILLMDVCKCARLSSEHAEGQDQNVFPVDSLGFDFCVLVGLLKFDVLRWAQAGNLGPGCRNCSVFIHAEHRELAPFDLGCQFANASGFEPDLLRFGHLGNQCGFGFEHRRCRDPGKLGPKVFQLGQRGRVESLDGDSADAQLTQSCTKFTGGAICVGKRQNAIGRVVTLGDSVGNSMSNSASFSGAGAGKDAGGADQRSRGFLLFGVETFENQIRIQRDPHTSVRLERRRWKVCPEAIASPTRRLVLLG